MPDLSQSATDVSYSCRSESHAAASLTVGSLKETSVVFASTEVLFQAKTVEVFPYSAAFSECPSATSKWKSIWPFFS